MKGLFFGLIASMLLFSGSAFAFGPSVAEVRANFQTCRESSSSWMQRWGKYVVAYDLRSAQNACQKSYGNNLVTVKSTGCWTSGSWKIAGFYCEELSPGGI